MILLLNSARGSYDRFIAPREYCHEMRRRLSYNTDGRPPVDIWFSEHFQQKKYTDTLDEAFGLVPEDHGRDSRRPWPCHPRKKSYLASADSVLDLPTYSYAVLPELLDWSSDNILVAALGRNYHRWSWRSQRLVNKGITLSDTLCCKFDPRGQYLLLGTNTGNLEVHDNQTKHVNGSLCPCYNIDGELCCISAVDWSPTGNSYVIGCTRGRITSFSRDSSYIDNFVSKGTIFLLRVSPDARFLAASAVKSDLVDILTWPSLQKCLSLHSMCTNKTMAWHPWRSALLGVGHDGQNDQARIAFLDVPTSKLEVTDVGQFHHRMDAMLFSHRTGELVVSLRNLAHSVEFSQTQLLVLSDPQTVVDRWGEHHSGLQRVRTMVFSPDGTKLATATEDEDLIIWNFLPEDIKKKSKYKRFTALPVYLDLATMGYSLR